MSANTVNAAGPHHKFVCSLRRQLLIPLLLGGINLLILVVIGTNYMFENQVELRLKQRSEYIATSIEIAAENVESLGSLRRIVAAMAAEPGVELLMVVSGPESRVIASSQRQWLNQKLGELSDAEIRAQMDASRIDRDHLAYGFGENDSLFWYAQKSRLTIAEKNPLQPVECNILARISTREIRERVWKSFINLCLFGLVGGVALLALIYRQVQRHVIAPLANINGQLAASIELTGDINPGISAKNEIGTLVKTLNEVANHWRIAESKHKQAETDLANQLNFKRELITGSGAAIIATTTEGTITLFNPAAEALLGYRAAEMVGKLTPGVFHDPGEVAARAAELSAELGRTIAPGFEVFVVKTRSGEPETREWTYLPKGGGRVPVLLTFSTLRDTAGTITGYLGVARDITERRRLAEQLEERLAERETLLQEVHHRVKNNLQVITSLLAMQQRRAISADVAAEFQTSRDRIAAIALIHEQLYGSHGLDRVDFARFIRQLGANMLQGSNSGGRVNFEVKDGTFSVDLQRAVPCALLVNELVTNALKHGFPGDRRGKIEVELKADADGARHIYVRDDGVGMAAELAKGAQTSLGMRLVNRLVDQLDAKMELLAQTPGTQYHILLPGEKQA